MRGQFRDIGLHGIHNNGLGLIQPHSRLHPQTCDRIGLCNVGSDNEDGLRFIDLLRRIHHAMKAQGMLHGPNKIQMPISGAAVQMIGANNRTHKFLKHIQIFVGTPGCNKPGDGLRTILRFDVG